MRRRRFSRGTTIFRQGDPAREFFVLTAGRIEVTLEGGDPEVPPVAVINAPHWFGELAVLTGPIRFVTITASSDCEVWVLSRDRFEACVAKHPVIYRNLIASLSMQIQRKYHDFVDQSGLAIERARFVSDLQQRNAELAALADITRGVSESLDLDPTLQTISTHAAQLTQSDAACIFLYDQERGAFSIRASYNTAEQYLRETGDRRLPFEGTASPGLASSRSLVVQSATERLPVQIADVAATRDYPSRDLLLRCGYRGVLVVPLLNGERVIGALSVLRNRSGEFSPREVELVTTFASHSAIALEHARLFQELAEWNRTLEQRVASQLAELERVGRLKRFLAPQLAEVIVASGEEEKLLESHRREITVVFCDLRGFTAFSETAKPDAVMGVLREYHTAMGALIFRFEGTLERFAGDGLMVFFNDPIPCADAPVRAVRMAVKMRERVGELVSAWHERGHDLGFGVGIALGDATLGRIGFEGRFDYGAIGPVTNLASRLCHEAQGGQILISQRVYGAVEGIVDAEPLGELVLKGFHRPLTAYNILRLKD